MKCPLRRLPCMTTPLAAGSAHPPCCCKIIAGHDLCVTGGRGGRECVNHQLRQLRNSIKCEVQLLKEAQTNFLTGEQAALIAKLLPEGAREIQAIAAKVLPRRRCLRDYCYRLWGPITQPSIGWRGPVVIYNSLHAWYHFSELT